MQPRQRRQFFVVGGAVHDDTVGREGGRRRPDGMVLVMRQRMAVAGAAAAGNDQVVTIVQHLMVRVHLFRRKEDNVADAVHALRGSYIILAQMSLLQHDQLGRSVRRWWRHRQSRRRRRRGSVAMDRCHAAVGNVCRRM